MVKCKDRERIPKNQRATQPVAAPVPRVTYNASSAAYPPSGPEPGLPVHATSIAMPLSYDQTGSTAPSAPPYNPYYTRARAY